MKKIFITLIIASLWNGSTCVMDQENPSEQATSTQQNSRFIIEIEKSPPISEEFLDAILKETIDIVKNFIIDNKDVAKLWLDTGLFCAAIKDNYKIASLLYNEGACVYTTKNGQTILEYAIKNNNALLTRLCIDQYRRDKKLPDIKINLIALGVKSENEAIQNTMKKVFEIPLDLKKTTPKHTPSKKKRHFSL